MGGDYDTGVSPRFVYQPKRDRRLHIWLILIAVLILIPIGLSVRRRMELVSEPPQEFFAVRPGWSAERREAEARLAREYWECAVATVQTMYPYGFGLPESPPPEFRIDAEALSEGVKETPETRQRYWQRLRKVWGLEQAWRESYGWDTDWLIRPFTFWRGLKNR